jgi:hypothetical protein
MEPANEPTPAVSARRQSWNPTQEEIAREIEINQRAYEAQRDFIRREYAGQMVAFAHGRVIAVAPSYTEAQEALLAIDPPPANSSVFRAEDDPGFDAVHVYYSGELLPE